ncbi:hypothetical protein AGDE_16939 [Angomonas deanei]|nr:hypothetical protein AGDE_16939 [Angomonas deanei]|eukprot:EPY15855.1 hypothetical protein AGDE_16939 [Angomonas deanei]
MFYFLFYELIFLRDYKKNKRTLHFLLSAVSNLFCLPRCFTIIKNMNNKLLYETTVYPNPPSEDNHNPSNSSNDEEQEVDVDLKSDTESNNNNNSAVVYNKKDNLRRFALMLLSLFYTRGNQHNRGSYIFSSEVALVTVFVDGLLNLMDSFKEHYKVQKKLEEFYAAKNIKVNNNNSDNDVDKVTEEDFYLFLTTLVFGDALRDSCENSNKTNKNLFFNLQQLMVHFDDQQYCSTQILKFLEIVSIAFCSVT